MQAIDIHGHFVPESVVQQLQRSPSSFPSIAVRDLGDRGFTFLFAGVEQYGPMPLDMMSIPEITGWMDEARLDAQIEGTFSSLFGYTLPADEAAAWSRFLNEETLRAVEGNDRILAVATVPIQDGRRAVQELEAARKMGYPGVTIGTVAPGRELDHPDLEVFWEAAAALDMPIFLHPMHPAEDVRVQAYGLPSIVGRTTDTTIAVSRMLCAGTLLRHPDLKLILAHGGGTLPYLLGRLRRLHDYTPGIADPQAGFQRLYFDSAVYEPKALRFLVDLAGPDRVMVGSDSPFRIKDPSPRRVVEEASLDPGVVEAILSGNARNLFHLQPVIRTED